MIVFPFSAHCSPECLDLLKCSMILSQGRHFLNIKGTYIGNKKVSAFIHLKEEMCASLRQHQDSPDIPEKFEDNSFILLISTLPV